MWKAKINGLKDAGLKVNEMEEDNKLWASAVRWNHFGISRVDSETLGLYIVRPRGTEHVSLVSGAWNSAR